MKRVSKLMAVVAVATAMVWQFASCEKYILPEIKVTPDTLRFASAAGSQTSFVTSNVKCSVSISKTEEGEEITWLTCDKMDYKGKGEELFTLTVIDNVTGRRRIGNVLISSEAFEKKIVVIQD